MKKFFSVFVLVLVLSFSTITALANTNATVVNKDVTVETFAGSIYWNGEAFELGVQDDQLLMLLTFDDLTELYVSEYFAELDNVSLHFICMEGIYEDMALESFTSFARRNDEVWEVVVTLGDEHILWIFDSPATSYENEYPVELKALHTAVGGWYVYRFMPVVVEEPESNPPVAFPFITPSQQPTSVPVVPVAPQQVPVSAAEVAPAPTSSGYYYVWLSATGTRWHSINNCGRMNPANARQVRLDYARGRYGFGPCAICAPPR